jgi:hypothetical protein
MQYQKCALICHSVLFVTKSYKFCTMSNANSTIQTWRFCSPLTTRNVKNMEVLTRCLWQTKAIFAHVSTQHDTWPNFCQKTSVSTHRGALTVSTHRGALRVDKRDEQAHSLFTQTKSPDGARRHSNVLRRAVHIL